jgi:hypothetical protein
VSNSIRNFKRSLGNFVNISLNRILGRSFVPHPRKAICIETSGRCNLSCRFCAYPKRGPIGFLEIDDFISTVKQSSALGIRDIWLTPMLGEVFAGKNFMKKLEYLESNKDVDSYSFFTNFILCNDSSIQKFQSLTKLSSIHISVYGHDDESFQNITQKPRSQYLKLLQNLSVLEQVLKIWAPIEGVHFSIRTYGGINKHNLPNTKMTQTLNNLAKSDNVDVMVATEYDNWGGTIEKEDVESLGINLFDGTGLYRTGACTLLFSGPRIASDRSVHACACRDVDDSLLLGHLDQSLLSDIISIDNPAYVRIIKEQQAGIFSKNCSSCSMYRSIYDHRASTHDSRLEVITFNEATKLMEKDT